MKKLLLVVGFVAAMLLGAASSASAAGQVCYDISIQPVGIAQAGCQALP